MKKHSPKLTEITLKGKLKAKIYDECLPPNVFKEMQKILLGPEFPWFYNYTLVKGPYFYNYTAPIKGHDNDNNSWQFTHLFHHVDKGPWSNWTETIVPILNFIRPRAWIRVKANLSPKEPSHKVGGWHYDMSYGPDQPYKDTLTGVLNMNTTNGYTLMETGQKIKSIENRLVLHPNNVLHTGITQTDKQIRVLLNFNFFGSKE